MQLTDEQQRIVHHDTGPAIVYAVAGAGKSTTLAHRVVRLVKARGVAPSRILVCSFSRETVGDIRAKIEALGVAGTHCVTFNALGRRLVQQAVSAGHWPAFDEKDIEHKPAQLAMRALIELGRRQGKNFATLDLNPEDLQTWISICKGNLRYARLADARLPAEGLNAATQAAHPDNAHYPEAYRIYEELRQQSRSLTFDDQLLLGWEALIRFPDVRAAFTQAYDYVLVDEYQDVNLVQVQLADILTERHRNFMAIGDDDQCIYEWRGAAVRFILDFRDRYNAAEYTISDNFRCPAEATLLAGKVIAANTQRHPKELVSQKGFGGNVVLKGFASDSDLARHVVDTYQAHLAQGGVPKDAIVLVRSYAQTPAIEARLIEQGLPYRIIGSQRFYERPEVRTLFTYLGYARQEREIARGKGQPSEQYTRRFADVIRTPNRFLSNDWINRLRDQSLVQQESVLTLIERGFFEVPNEGARKKLLRFVQVIRALQQKLEDNAADTLFWLITELDYLDYLQKSAGVAELGEERCKNVRALVQYARSRGRVGEFLEHIRRLHVEEDQSDSRLPALHIMSIHRSKGLQWPLVLVPSCADDQIPGSADNQEEERRLLYVAMTRTQRDLHLLHAPQDKMSRFLEQAGAPEVLIHADMLRLSLLKDEGALTADDVVNLALGMCLYPLARYLEVWWRPSASQVRAMTQQLHLALQRQPAALLQVEQFKTRLAEAEAAQPAVDESAAKWRSLERRLFLFRERYVNVVLHAEPPADAFAGQCFRFEEREGQIRVRLGEGGKVIGWVDGKHSKFPVDQVHCWDWVEGEPPSSGQRLSQSRRSLFLKLRGVRAPDLTAGQTAPGRSRRRWRCNTWRPASSMTIWRACSGCWCRLPRRSDGEWALITSRFG